MRDTTLVLDRVDRVTTYTHTTRRPTGAFDKYGATQSWETRAFDGSNRIVRSTVLSGSGTTTRDQLWDTVNSAVPQIVAASADGGGVWDRTVSGPGGLIADTDTTGTKWFQTDARGSVIRTDDTNTLVVDGPTAYDPQGKPAQATPGYTSRGYRGETETAGLLHLRARDYDPTTGAFLTQDPLDGVNGTTTAANPYPYANNDPLNKVDPLGLRASDGSLRYARAWACALAGGACSLGPYQAPLLPMSAREKQSTAECLAGEAWRMGVTNNPSLNPLVVVDITQRLYDGLKNDTWATIEGFIPIWGSVKEIDSSETFCQELIGYAHLGVDIATLALAAEASAASKAAKAEAAASKATAAEAAASEASAASEIPSVISGVDDAATTARTASTSWGRTIDDFQQHGDQWRRLSAHAEGASGRAYRGGSSIEEVFERGGDRLVRHRIYGPDGEILHETFRPYAKFGAP